MKFIDFIFVSVSQKKERKFNCGVNVSSFILHTYTQTEVLKDWISFLAHFSKLTKERKKEDTLYGVKGKFLCTR
jgi:hypothetical protein